MNFPSFDIQQLLISIPPLLFALTLHEVAHGVAALHFGDPTAKNAGRLSLNPLRHLDPLGTLALLFVHFGWAKPVPVNPRYFKDPLKDMLWVALAGPVTNLLLAIISLILLKFMVVFNGSIPQSILIPLASMLQISFMMNVMLCIFNFLPIPPLDGSRILAGILPREAAMKYLHYERYGMLILLALMITGVFGVILQPILIAAQNMLIFVINF
ncbi:site-2 protease family protein [Desulforhopalus vacuolatus]|uniref:site-2 protease family protein n=1 Tax=Desulforhopalus vacuolatus TaxID=40414 RepID=UPI001966B4D5|nr:site-2 protease family protein [Desulforhopalus vacuolatus]MBM9520460.1 site-2 protease family protein [Desulforhopalus vacuolatus]